jgi:signal transduction histidine kinase/ActR/RegA family two-component response regulator
VQSRSLRLNQLLFACALVVPAAVFGAAAWHNRIEVLSDAEQAVVRTDAILDEHARKVFETVNLTLMSADERVRNASWDAIASPETSAYLSQLKAPLEHVVSIWIADASGQVRAGSQPWDPHVSITDRDFFRAHIERDVGTYISAAFIGRATSTASFAVSRRRSTPDGRFDGTIHVALSPGYFAHVFQETAPPIPYRALLVRLDGAVLAREPARRVPDNISASSAVMQGIAAQPEGGFFRRIFVSDGREWLYAHRKVANYPVHIGFGMETEVALRPWWRNVRAYGIIAGASASILLLLCWLVARALRAEQAALLRLSKAHEQRLQAEQRMAQMQKVESLGQLTGGIAHDFNNLLAAILGNLDLIGKRLPDDPRMRRQLDGALEGAKRGAALTQRLLAFARRQDLVPQTVDLPALVGGMTELLTRSLGPSIRITTTFPTDLPGVKADPNQLEMALLNLAVNARDAMPLGGSIVVSGKVERLADADAESVGLAPGSYVRLSVSDTGMGMDAETLARATEPFFTTKGIGKGTGLGLSMIQGFAEQSGGVFRLASTPQGGTTAEIWLPQASEAAAKADSAAREQPKINRSCRILVVDDDPLVLAGTAGMLEDLGHEVIEASSGEQAVEVVERDAAIELVVTDLSMPGMSGLELARYIREHRRNLPVILASGHMDLHGTAGHDLPRLAKPFRQDDLAGLIARVMPPRPSAPNRRPSEAA